MRRDVQAVVLVLVGAALLRITLGGEMYLRYVKAGLRPALIAAGVVLLALGLTGVVRDGLLRVHEREEAREREGRRDGEEALEAGREGEVTAPERGEAPGGAAARAGGEARARAAGRGRGRRRREDREHTASGELCAADDGRAVAGTAGAAGGGRGDGARPVGRAGLVPETGDAPGCDGARPVGREDDGAARADAAAADHGAGHGHGAAHDDGHGHDHSRGPRVAWLMCLPVLALFLVSPPALGAYTASRSANAVVKPASVDAGFPGLPPGDPLEMTPGEFSVRAVWDTAEHLKGRHVAMLGFVTPGPGGTWYLTRLTLSCCAADARTFKIEMHGAAAPPADTWVRVTGTWLPNGKVQDSEAVPAFTVGSLERVPAPKDPYE